MSESEKLERLMRALASLEAPRAIGVQGLLEWARSVGLMESIDRMRLKEMASLALEAAQSGALLHAGRGVFLNQKASPRPNLEEALDALWEGSVSSFQTVLGRSGALRNPARSALGLIAESDERKWGSRRVQQGQLGALQVIAAPQSLLDPEQDWWDKLSPEKAFQPEKALLDWLWVSKLGHGAPAAADLIWERLSAEKLERWGAHLGLLDPLATLLERASDLEPPHQALARRLGVEPSSKAVLDPQELARRGRQSALRARAGLSKDEIREG